MEGKVVSFVGRNGGGETEGKVKGCLNDWMTTHSFDVLFVSNVARGVGEAEVGKDTKGREGFAPMVLL